MDRDKRIDDDRCCIRNADVRDSYQDKVEKLAFAISLEQIRQREGMPSVLMVQS